MPFNFQLKQTYIIENDKRPIDTANGVVANSRVDCRHAWIIILGGHSYRCRVLPSAITRERSGNSMRLSGGDVDVAGRIELEVLALETSK